MTEPVLGPKEETAVCELLDKREQAIVSNVVALIGKGELSSEYAVQQWQAVAEIRRLKSALTRRGAQERAQYPKEL